MPTPENFPVWPGWETVRVIGRGSYGAVYEIRHDIFGDIEKAALKQISIPQTDSEISELRDEGMDDDSITESFKEQARELVNEYMLMRRLNNCPYVVSCDDVRNVQHRHDFGWDILIKMELLTPLPSVVGAEQALPEGQVIRLGRDLCRALIHCRKYNIVHRDIKPRNIFVSDEGLYKLGDFGIARTKVGSGTGTARIGTYDYMAPEVYHGEHYGAAADLYSLGIVLYWLLNRRRTPFQPLDKVRMTLADKEEARTRRLDGEVVPAPVDGSPELQRIVLKACAYDPKERYQSAEEMLQALEALDEGPADSGAGRPAIPVRAPERPLEVPAEDATLTGSARQANRNAPVPAAPAAKEPNRNNPPPVPPEDGTVAVHSRPRPAAETAPVKKKAKAPWALIAVLALVLMAGGAFFALRKPAEPRATEPTPAVEAAAPVEEPAPVDKAAPVEDAAPSAAPAIEKPRAAATEKQTPTETGAAATESAVPSSEPVNSDISYRLDGSTLTVSGTGKIGSLWEIIPELTSESSVSTVIIEPGITSIGYAAFRYCSSLRSVVLPDGITSVERFAFADCSNLRSVTLCEGITFIGESAFSGCSSLSYLTIPESVTSIGNSAFFGCRSLSSVNLPASMSSIGDSAFSGCSSLGSVTIPDGIPSIGSMTFFDCRGLSSVSIPEGVTSIDKSAFSGCSSLSSVAIPVSVTSIGNMAFYHCDSLTNVLYGGALKQWASVTIGSYNEPLTSANIHFNAS